MKLASKKTLLVAALIPLISNAGGNNTISQLGDTIKKKVESYSIDAIESSTKSTLSNYFNHVEFGINSIGGQNGPEVELITTKAYDNNGEANSFLFNQLGVNRYDGDTTVNIGLGWRHITDDKLWMYGVNGFYDRELDAKHDRTSIGAEIASSVIRANYNSYQGKSGWITSGGVTEKALDGKDYNVFVRIPYLPTSELRLNGFEWEGLQSAANLKGKSLSLITDIENLRLEVGRTDYDAASGRTDDNFTTLKYVVPFGGKSKPTNKASKKAFVFQPIDNKVRYAPVKRQNRIIKQKKFAATVTGT